MTKRKRKLEEVQFAGVKKVFGWNADTRVPKRMRYRLCAFLLGVRYGFRAGKKEGKAEAMKACGWGDK